MNPGMDNSLIRILVLDDEPFMHRLLAHMLAELGFASVATCDNGPAALAWVDAPGNAPELILLDLNMPRMDGIEFVRKLVEHEYTGSLILVSGEAERVLQMTEKLVQAHRIPVLGHLRKPVSPAGLAELIARWRPAQVGLPAAKVYGADELRAAIANGELVNYYQPKVAAASGVVVGVEALVRWRHPVDGLVPPHQFIRVAEENGLIGELTRAVLTAAMTQATVWRQAGVILRVAVNVSMESLSAVSFADFIAETALAAGVSPQDIVLELTETGLLPDQRASLEILARLRLKRFRLSIDDFGTGNSSLTQLRDIAFDELKIDRSFVSGASRDETTRAMYDASLGLGRQLDMVVVAEGVEDRDDWDLIRSTGCDLAQGYFIAHPMPASELVAWMQSWSDRAEELQVSA
jgi:EAL domain-containing protein (putative c-di-GMP-specific phosphodiesterase class I)/ActR/RegA family two-component response regulator